MRRYRLLSFDSRPSLMRVEINWAWKEWIYGRWSEFEVLAHEMGHLLLNHLSKVDGKKRPAHRKEFCDLWERWRLHPTPVVGSHYAVADEDKPFGRIMKS